MRTVCITTIERPHLIGPGEETCWCRPERVEADCDCHAGQVVWGHGYVEARPDTQPRMAVFSEQYHRGSWPAPV